MEVSLENIKILLVAGTNDAFDREMRELLDRAGAGEIVTTKGLDDTLTMMASQPFDLIIGEVGNSRFGGSDFERVLDQGTKANENTPVLMIADNPSKADLITAFKGGISSFLMRPLNLEKLVEHLGYLVAPPVRRWSVERRTFSESPQQA